MSDEPPLSPDLSSTLADLEHKLSALESDLSSARARPAPEPPSDDAMAQDAPEPTPAAPPPIAPRQAEAEPAAPPGPAAAPAAIAAPPAPPAVAAPPAGPHARETAEALAASLTLQLEQIIASAEQVAADMQVRAEAESTRLMAEAEERAREDGERIRRAAQAAADEHLQRSRREIDEFAQARITRIGAIADRLTADSEHVLERLTEAAALRRALDSLLAGLTEASEKVVREARGGEGEQPSAEPSTD